MSLVLKAEYICKTYRKNTEMVHVLDGINLSIHQGEIVLLMGPSGSGKSTLLNILGTLDLNFKGNLYIDDIGISSDQDLSSIRSSKIGFVFQFHHLLPEFTVLENLQIPQLMLGSNNDINNIHKMLSYIGLEERKNHYPDEISGGEKQRVAVIRSLVGNPLLILADEPTGNLDRENSQLLLNLISDLRDKYRQSFLIATHDDLVAQIADRILYLKDGVIKEGT